MSEIRAQDYFAIIPEWVIYADVSNAAVRLYAVLARFANSQGRAWPSRRTLADLMKCSMSSIDRAKDELISIGALSVEHRTNPSGDPSSNLYTIFTHPHGKASPSSPVARGMVISEGRGMVTRDALNRVNMKQSQQANSAPVKKCSTCLGKNRDIEGKAGLSCVHVKDISSNGKVVGYTYVICPDCDGSGVAS